MIWQENKISEEDYETLMMLDHVRCGIVKRSIQLINNMSSLTDIMSWDTILTRKK